MNKSKQAKDRTQISPLNPHPFHPHHRQWLKQKECGGLQFTSSQVENAHKTRENPGLFVKKCVKIYVFDFEGL